MSAIAEEILSKIAKTRIVPVVAIEDAADTASLCEALIAGHIPCAEITFITPSACARSILPFRSARFVNSPGPAGTAPSASTRRSSFCVTNSPPWQQSSATSSPV